MIPPFITIDDLIYKKNSLLFKRLQKLICEIVLFFVESTERRIALIKQLKIKPYMQRRDRTWQI